MFPMGTMIPDFLVGFPESIKVRLQHGWRGERTGTFPRHFCGSALLGSFIERASKAIPKKVGGRWDTVRVVWQRGR